MNVKRQTALLAIFLFVVSAFALINCGTADAAKKRIGVTDFENKSRVYGLGAGIADMLVVELVKNKNFEVIERDKLRSVMAEQALGASGAVNPATAARLGELMGLDYLVVGSIVEASLSSSEANLGSLGINLGVNETTIKVVAQMRLIDANTGQIVLADSAEGEVKKSRLTDQHGRTLIGDKRYSMGVFSEAARIAVARLVDKINEVNPLEGLVIKVSGRMAYIDLGRDQGVQEGQEFTVYREGEVIVHPVTGKILSVTRDVIGRIKITSVEPDLAIGEFIDMPRGIITADDLRSGAVKVRRRV